MLLAAVSLCGAAGASVAAAGEGSASAAAFVEPSPAAGLLPPIAIDGRKGWRCAAERRATATNAADSALPEAG
jgi:hypothetical protein